MTHYAMGYAAVFGCIFTWCVGLAYWVWIDGWTGNEDRRG